MHSITIPSDCHLPTNKVWTPEPGSKEYQKRWDGWRPNFAPDALELFARVADHLKHSKPIVIKLSGPKKYTPLKTHWSSNIMCMHAAADADNVVSGELFNRVPEDERCRSCEYWFMNA